MKEKFLQLIQEIKESRLAERLYLAKNSEELETIWKEFWDGHVRLFAKIRIWERNYIKSTENQIYSEVNCLFEEYEIIRDAMEIAIFVRILEKVTESNLFEGINDFSFALSRIDNSFAKRVSDLSYHTLIRNIKTEDIFI